jgi:hypothetical protein
MPFVEHYGPSGNASGIQHEVKEALSELLQAEKQDGENPLRVTPDKVVSLEEEQKS